MNYVGFNHQVLIDEIRRIHIISVNSSDPPRRQIHFINSVVGKESVHSMLVREIKLFPACSKYPMAPLSFQITKNRGAHHSFVTSDKYLPPEIAFHLNFPT